MGTTKTILTAAGTAAVLAAGAQTTAPEYKAKFDDLFAKVFSESMATHKSASDAKLSTVALLPEISQNFRNGENINITPQLKTALDDFFSKVDAQYKTAPNKSYTAAVDYAKNIIPDAELAALKAPAAVAPAPTQQAAPESPAETLARYKALKEQSQELTPSLQQLKDEKKLVDKIEKQKHPGWAGKLINDATNSIEAGTIGVLNGVAANQSNSNVGTVVKYGVQYGANSMGQYDQINKSVYQQETWQDLQFRSQVLQMEINRVEAYKNALNEVNLQSVDGVLGMRAAVIASRTEEIKEYAAINKQHRAKGQPEEPLPEPATPFEKAVLRDVEALGGFDMITGVYTPKAHASIENKNLPGKDVALEQTKAPEGIAVGDTFIMTGANFKQDPKFQQAVAQIEANGGAKYNPDGTTKAGNYSVSNRINNKGVGGNGIV